MLARCVEYCTDWVWELLHVEYLHKCNLALDDSTPIAYFIESSTLLPVYSPLIK
jgi:hypothetical protein